MMDYQEVVAPEGPTPVVYSLCSKGRTPTDRSVFIHARVFRDVRHGPAIHDAECPDQGHLAVTGDRSVFETREGQAFAAAGDFKYVGDVLHLGPEDAGYSTTVLGRFELFDGWPGVRFRIEKVVSVEADGDAR